MNNIRRIYADNAATTKMSDGAVKIMADLLANNYGNASSLHKEGQEAAKVLQNSREIFAKCLNAEPREIYFTSGGSEADNQAILTGIKLGNFKNKRHIISTKFEHHGVLNLLEKLAKDKFGNKLYDVEFLEVGRNGLINLEDLKSKIREDTALVSIMFANNEIGTIQPIYEIGNICAEKKVLFHTDAVQACGHLEIDVKKLNIDMLSLAAHKFNGPKGVGVFYCNKKVSPESLIYGGAHERGKRAGTENIAGIAAAAFALKESCENMNERNLYVKNLRDKLIMGLSKINNSLINGSIKEGERLASNLNICFEGIEGESLLLMLDMHGIAASSGSACTSGSLDPSHVLLALGLPHEIAHGSLRLTLSHENTEQEVDYIIETVPKVVEYLRKMSPVWEKIERGIEKSRLCGLAL